MNLYAILLAVKSFFIGALPWFIFLFAIYLVARIIFLFIKCPSKIIWTREIGYALLCLYIIFILSSTVLPEVATHNGINIYYPDGGFGTSHMSGEYLNLIPGNIFMGLAHSFKFYDGFTLWISILGNIMLFFPFGFLFSLLYDSSIKVNLLVGSSFSLLIELYQLFLARATDVDDVILNTIGMLLGCLLARLALRLKYVKHKKQ